MPSIYVGTTSSNPPSMAGVGTVSEIIIPQNTERSGLVITNISDGTIYLGIGNTATLKAGIVLTPAGGVFSFDDYTYSKDAITAIAHSSTLVIAFQEFIRV